MWLLSTGPNTEWDAKGQTIKEIFDTIGGALDKLQDPATTMRGLTEMEDKARSLQRTMSSGMVFESSNFREQLFKSYNEVLKMGGTFEDITNSVQGFSKGMEKIVFMTSDTTQFGETFAESLVGMSKTTGLASESLGGMVAEFMRLEGSQIKSIETMQKLAKTARMSGVDSGKLLEEIKGSITKIDSYGFKSGLEGLTKMAIQAKQLRTSVDEIGALSKSVDLWDPEKAIETAANMQMLGGSIGSLGDPFKLMNMGMNDVEALQNQMIDLAASAYKVNEKTGEIEIDPLSRQRLKAQAEAMGTTLDKMTKIGREAFKAKQVMSEMSGTGLADIPKDQKDLLASLTEFKGGKMSIDIPGLKTDDLATEMEKSPAKIQAALEDYQKKAALSDKDLAVQGLTLQEQLNADARVIRDTLLTQLGDKQRQTIIDQFRSGIDIVGGNVKEGVNQAADIAREGVKNVTERFKEGSKDGGKISAQEEGEKKTEERNIGKDKINRGVSSSSNSGSSGGSGGSGGSNSGKGSAQGGAQKEDDAAFSTGNKVLSLGKGEMFNFIKEDEAVFAPNLLKNLDILKKTYEDSFKIKNNFESNRSLDNIKQMSSAPSSIKTESTQKIEASGDINININVNTSGTLSDALMKDRAFTQELKNRVMTIIKDKSKISVEKGQVR
jgi:hypothetical protein